MGCENCVNIFVSAYTGGGKVEGKDGGEMGVATSVCCASSGTAGAGAISTTEGEVDGSWDVREGVGERGGGGVSKTWATASGLPGSAGLCISMVGDCGFAGEVGGGEARGRLKAGDVDSKGDRGVGVGGAGGSVRRGDGLDVVEDVFEEAGEVASDPCALEHCTER